MSASEGGSSLTTLKRKGGHYVDPGIIKGVYETNLKYVDQYKNTFIVLELYDGMKVPALLARFEHNEVVYAVKQALDKKLVEAGPSYTG